jgi:hypothetical protein
MAAGLVSVTILDGTGVQRTEQFWSSNGAVTGTLSPISVILDPNAGTAIDQTATVNVAPDTATIKNGATSLTPKFASISSTGSADTVALVSSKKIRIVSMFFVVAGATTVKFQTGATTDLTGAQSFAINGGISLPYNPVGWFETTVGAKLNHVLGASVGIAGALTYIEV